MLMKRKLRVDTRASASVEFSLLALFFLAPLLVSAVDFVIYIAGQAQLNTALQALYYNAITDPADAATASKAQLVLNAINSGSIYPVTLAKVTAKTACMASGSLTYIASNTSCPPNAVQTTAVYYSLSTHVSLPFPVPLKLTNPVLITASGQTLD
jgi:Flp pilus assembly protein TadG